MNGTEKYADLLNMDPPEPDPKKHPRMSAVERAAQFSPFAALTGYADVLDGALTEHLDLIQ